MREMVYYELKKIFSKSANKIALILLAAALCIVNYFAIGKVRYVDENGERTIGIAAAQVLREEKDKWAGYITEDVLRKALEENTRINNSDEYLSEDLTENEKAYAKKLGFSDIREMINRAFSGFQEYNYYRVDSVATEEIDSFYDRRTTNLIEWLHSDEMEGYYSKEEEQFLITQYEKLKTPFYYEDADGWEAVLEYAPMIIMLTVLITGFLVSGIFSDEIQLKADAIFFASKLGRNKATAAKVKAGFLVITAGYWSILSLFSAIVLGVLGTGGAGCAIQNGFSNWKSFYNITYLQDYLLTVSGGYIGSLFILFLSMLVSAKTHSKALAATLPFLLLFLPSFLSGTGVLSEVLGLFPDQLLQLCMAVKTFQLYQIGEHVIGSVPIVLTLYAILSGALVPAMYGSFRKTEVK